MDKVGIFLGIILFLFGMIRGEILFIVLGLLIFRIALGFNGRA